MSRKEENNRVENSGKNLLERITFNPEIFGGKPIVRGRRLGVEHILGLPAAGDSPETILEGYDWLELDDIRACEFMRQSQGNEFPHYTALLDRSSDAGRRNNILSSEGRSA